MMTTLMSLDTPQLVPLKLSFDPSLCLKAGSSEYQNVNVFWLFFGWDWPNSTSVGFYASVYTNYD